MPQMVTIHFNPPGHGKTRCGRSLSRVKWSKDINDCSCNNCIRFESKANKFNQGSSSV